MAFKLVAVDENARFPPRIEARLRADFGGASTGGTPGGLNLVEDPAVPGTYIIGGDAGSPGTVSSLGVIGVRSEYDAVGDGVTDDTAALQAAINELRSYPVTDPPLSRPVVLDGEGGIFRITNSLDLTGIQLGRGWEIRNLQIVAACPGKIGLDFTGSRFLRLTNVRVWGVQDAQPHTGIALSRTSTLTCSNSVFDNVTVDGYFTSSALHMNATEVNRFFGCDFWNRRVPDSGGEAFAAILDGSGYKALPSLYRVPSTSTQSFTVNTFYGCTFQKPFGVVGPTMFMQDIASATFDSCYGTNGGGSLIVWRLTSFVPYRIYMDFQLETTGIDRFIYFQGDTAGSSREIRGLHCTFGNMYTDQEVFASGVLTALAIKSFKCHIYRWVPGVQPVNKVFVTPAVVSLSAADVVVPAASDFPAGAAFAAINGTVVGMDGTRTQY